MNPLDDLTLAHLQLAEENREFAKRIMAMDSGPPRWAATVAFYSAVHYLGAYFWAQHQIEVTSHRHRSRLVRSETSLDPAREHYEQLYYRSLEARYRPRASVPTSQARDLLETDLEAIRRHVTNALGD